jgi:hypothetical protein
MDVTRTEADKLIDYLNNTILNSESDQTVGYARLSGILSSLLVSSLSKEASTEALVGTIMQIVNENRTKH